GPRNLGPPREQAHQLDQVPPYDEIVPIEAELECCPVERRGVTLLVVGEEAHDAHQALANDLVVAIEFAGQSLAIENLLVDRMVDRRAECAGVGKSAALCVPLPSELRDLGGGDHDRLRDLRLDLARAGRTPPPSVRGEQEPPDQQEVEGRQSEPVLHDPGLYQFGEVQARSAITGSSRMAQQS